MCGIYALIGPATKEYKAEDIQVNGQWRSKDWDSREWETRLSSRGPDNQQWHFSLPISTTYSSSDFNTVTRHRRIPTQSPETYTADMFSSVLCLRSDDEKVSVIRQPLFTEAKDLRHTLLWNGEAWRIGGKLVHGNDSRAVFNLLKQTSLGTDDRDTALHGYAKAFASIEGPFSLIYSDMKHGLIFWGRDYLGRRSLLRRQPAEQTVEISSTMPGHQRIMVFELGTTYISYGTFVHASDPGRVDVTGSGSINDNEGLYWNAFGGALLWTPREYDAELPDDETAKYPYRMVQCSSYLGMTAADALQENRYPPINKSLPQGNIELSGINSSIVSQAYHLLIEGMKLRVLGIRDPNASSQTSARIAILFSGGLDCTILARLAHDILPPEESIDLLNVAFENPRVIAAAKNQANAHSSDNLSGETSAYERCPDRQTARRSLAELQSCCPGRALRLLTLDIPHETYKAHEETIRTLICPAETEMDLSIGAAFYFASRGIDSSQDPEPTMSPCTARVLLSGFGADELFAGYRRHQIAFQRGGSKELIEELDKDFARIGARNLGRDDRVLSHWGRETRYPYLDDAFLCWALKLPVWEKCGFGVGDDDTTSSSKGSGGKEKKKKEEDFDPAKRTLRLLAAKLGMPGVAREPKRAIQFGARTAKMERGKSRGTDVIVH